MTPLAITLLILAVAVAFFVWNRLPVGIVALGVAIALWATGVLTIEQSLSGFGSTTVVLIAALFVVAEGLDSAGITTWAGEQVMAHAGDSQTRLLVFTMLVAALLSAVLTPNGAAAALIPMAVILAVRMGAKPSRLLMPLAFSTHAGSLLVLTGSPVNVLVSEAAMDAGQGGLRFFEFARVGLPLVLGTIVIVVLFGSRLLPDRSAKTLPRDLSQLPRTLERQYLGESSQTGLVSADYGVAEVLVAPRSPYIGDAVFPGMTTESGELVVLAVQRHGDDADAGEVTLQAGDSLLLRGRWDALAEQTRDPNVLLVDAPEAVRRQATPLGPRTLPALLILAGMVALLTTGLVPAAIAGLLAAIAMILTGVVTVEQAHRSISWTTLILVAGMTPLSIAITETGAADLLATTMIGVVGGLGPWALLLGLFLISATVGQLISNTAIALILIPIALSISVELGVSPMPMLMAVNVAAAAALLTPVATPANMMVMGPAGYRFGDYAKLGLPLMLLYLVVAVFLVPVFWPW